ncbi:coiled-coil domain-containing protein 142 isoform X1 [Sphaerodactylus townsendi]|uniref:coiled-coil domain-containing protein 142 isoform X1 n=2 Tax=Sphaerodactylus townsendi TaxID=933632 RepID=UPI0020270AC1|nr:coiled-coil domain-containing protein 142 isoform X1 [Sphaerodactylus townsendi]
MEEDAVTQSHKTPPPLEGIEAIFLLFMARKSPAADTLLPPLSALAGPRKVAPAWGEEAEPGSSSRTTLAKSLQTAEALLRHCIHPNWRRLLPLRPTEDPEDSDEEEETTGGVAHLAQVERSFLGLSRSLCVREDLRTETFQGHVRPELPQAAFSYHAVWSGAARRCATMHALLQQHHNLRLARHYSRRLKAASDFVRRLRTAERSLLLPSGRQEADSGRLLRGLCEQLRTHTAHWDALQRHMRSDPWLRPLLLLRHEVVLRMKQALSLLALQALCLSERCLEALLRHLAHTTCLSAAPLSDFFQGLEIYNQVLRDQPRQPLWAEPGCSSGLRREPRGASAFPVDRVLGILAAERGQRAARKLCQLLLGLQARARSGEAATSWEGFLEPGLLAAAPQAGEGAPSLSAELQALCHVEEEHLLWILGKLVASTGSLWHHLLRRPNQERPPGGLEESHGPGGSDSASLPAWKTVHWLDASYSEAAGGLYAQCCPLLWSATAVALAHQLEVRLPMAQFQGRTVATLGQQLGHAPFHACVPRESTEELRGLFLRLLLREVLRHWDQDFCRALGSSLTDKCVAVPPRATEASCSRTAQLLHSLSLPLAFSLQCWDAWSPLSTAGHCLLGPAGCRLVLLSLSAAASQASCYWALGKASQHLAAGSLSPFLLVTQGDLQLLKTQASRLAALATADPSREEGKGGPLVSQQEQELCQQVDSMAASLQDFAQDALRLFSSECRRMAGEIFGQTMPLGKHWRLARQADVPCSPSEYASAATQAVLGQVLQGLQPLPREVQEPTLSQVTTAFLEAWLDHILTQKVRFSLQGALQLKQDFELVRELLQSEEAGLPAETRQRLLSLRVFQQVDNAVTCLLQQPGKASLPCQTWDALHQCCAYNGTRMQDGVPSSLNSLESLEGLPAHSRAAGESQPGDLLGCSPETYLSPHQQEWLALRLHGGRRWKVPGLPCMCRAAEP